MQCLFTVRGLRRIAGHEACSRGGSRDPARAGSACDGWAEPERVTPAGDWQTTGELAVDVPFLLRSYVHLLVRYLLYILRARLGPMPKDSSIKNIKTYLRAPARKSLARSLGLPPKFIILYYDVLCTDSLGEMLAKSMHGLGTRGP